MEETTIKQLEEHCLHFRILNDPDEVAERKLLRLKNPGPNYNAVRRSAISAYLHARRHPSATTYRDWARMQALVDLAIIKEEFRELL